MTEREDLHQNNWTNCMLRFKQSISTEDYTKWVAPLVLGGLVDGAMSIVVPNNSHAEFVESHFMNIMQPIIIKEFKAEVKSLRYILGDKINLQKSGDNNVIDKFLKASVPNSETNPYIVPGVNKIKMDSHLNFDLTFENFIEGDCNRLARSTGQNVALKPGESLFNPMFIYGDSGLGKTHVAQAIGIEVKKLYPDKNVLYVTMSEFITQFTTASWDGKKNDFTRFYQMTDVLIIDDIQELSGKPKSQIAFFGIFNHLHQNKKQLIFTCDKAPVELKDIENRIISRFKWAVTVPLTAPDFETKVAIIKSKAEMYKIELPQDIVEYLADNIHSNVRDLEGIVKSFFANLSFLKAPASIDMARRILSSYVTTKSREVTVDYIQKIVCDFYKIKEDDFQSTSRKMELVLARQVSMYLLKEFTELSLKRIGDAIGKKSHATVVHSCKTIVNLCEIDKEFAKKIEQIKKMLR